MKTEVTIEQVKERFKNAKKIKSAFGDTIYTIKDLSRVRRGASLTTEKDFYLEEVSLYDADKGCFAEIISYKSTKEKTPKKELKALLNLAKECLEKPDSIVCKEYKGKILDACPSLKVESDVLEVGNWYKTTHKGDDWFMYCTNIGNTFDSGYGFDVSESKFDTALNFNKNSYKWQKADPKKVEELLISEAKKRGFKKGVYVNKSCFKDVPLMTVGFSNNSLINSDCFEYFPNDNVLQLDNNSIFYNGNWATINEVISLSEAEKIIGKKIKID